ncbi:MAG TPA: bifunctional serine/threonine-protein kinase/formylglycine-generating enzyme family protein [Pyrinomonadaceae bacterium]|nr:bifunctional serine/threonine-protein kinase/formylglycine-generating enzyme family protein [Pyrinomonadaceae bacterium]
MKFTITGDPVLDGRYQLESRLAQGGMGVVFKGRHIFLKTLHAIKVILPDLVGNDPSLVTRFRQEAMAAAAIRHPNIVAVTDFGVVNGTTPFLVMEFIQGKSLSDLLSEEGRLAPARALEIIAGVGAGLGAAHRQGIVHRDLKPLNIMLRDDTENTSESIKLLDFGLAKIKSGELLGSFVAAQTTGLMGSPFYMAPEQWSEEEPDRRADIYSLGVILYQMLAGEVPFRGGSIPAIMKKHLTSEPPDLRAQNTGVSAEVEAVVRRALEKEPDRRPQTVEEFVAELHRAVNGGQGVTGAFRRADTMMDGAAFARDDSMGETGRTGAGFPGAGRETVADLSPSNTMHAPQPTGSNLGGTMVAGEGGAGGGGATFQGQHATEAHLPAPDPRSTVADINRHAPSNMQTGANADSQNSPGAQTGQQFADRTAYLPLTGESAPPPPARESSAQGHTMTGEPPVAGRETQVLDAGEMHRKLEDREQERQRLAAAQGQHARVESHEHDAHGEDAARGHLSQSSVAGNLTSPQLVPQHTVGPEHFAQPTIPPSSAARAQQQRAQQQQGAHAVGGASGVPPKKPRLTLILVASVVLVALVGGLAALGYVWMQKNRQADNVNTGGTTGRRVNANTNRRANTNAPSGTATTTTAQPATKPDLVELPGGTFQMGLDDVPEYTDAHSPAYLQWMYTQWPAHPVSVKPFAIDRTEVTNAEYAQFVNETGYPPPPGIWEGNQPKEGQELWPVRNVTPEDAQRFANWRSKRDGVAYRLPTEEEWEYAARGGTVLLYPWGNAWVDGRANLDSDKPAPVGSFKEGATAQGVQDLLGNVWEWTASEASMYAGNKRLKLRAEDAGMVVVRGGSYQSSARGDSLITNTTRTWQPKDKRDPVIGFRLVRPSGAGDTVTNTQQQQQ